MKKLCGLLAILLLFSLLAAPAAQAAPAQVTYTVEHYLEGLVGGDWALADRDSLSGETNAVSRAEARVYKGFTAQPFSQQPVKGDGSTVIRIYYSRNSYMLIWSTDGDPLTGNYTAGSVKYGAAIRTPDTPTKLGYTFAGWNSRVASAMPAAYTVYTAQWTPNPDTPYTVSHFIKDLEGPGYTLLETERLTGCTGAYTSVVAKSLIGFSSLPFSQETIAPDGTTAVSVYYDRDRYALVWDPAGGTLKGAYTGGSVLYGTPIVRPAVERNGFDFLGWNAEIADTMPAAYTTYTAQWSARPFYIRYNLNGGHLPTGTSNPTDYTADSPNITLVEPVREGYTFVGWIGTGLTAATKPVTVIAADRLDLTFSAVWQANTYSVTFHTNGGTINSGVVTAYTAGVGAALPTDVTRDGFVFLGWFADSRLSGSAVTGIGREESGDREFWAKWAERTGAVYLVRHWQQARNGSGYTLAETETLNASAGVMTAASPRLYEGFAAKPFSQETVKADGSTAVDIYYDRSFFNLAWDPRGGALSGSFTQGPTRYGADIVSPLVSRTGWRFDGWFQDPDYTVPWNGDSRYTGTELTLYAKWVSGDELHRVQVRVYRGSEEGTPVTDAVVLLRRGGESNYRLLTCAGEVYSVSDVSDGDYTLTVTSADGQTSVTASLRVEGADPALVKVVLPLGAVRTAVEIGQGSPAITVSGLDAIAGDPGVVGALALGQDVLLKLVFDAKDDLQSTADSALSLDGRADKAAQSRIRVAAVGDMGQQVDLTYYQVRLLKTVSDGYGNSTTEEITDTGDHVLTITIPYTGQSQNLGLYRDHEEADGSYTTSRLSRTTVLSGQHADGTYYRDDHSIICFCSKFSTLGVAEATAAPGGSGTPGGSGGGGGGGLSAMSVTVIPSEGGSVQPSASNAYPGETVTLKVTPESGYTLDSISVQDRNGNPVPTSVRGENTFFFVMPSVGVTVRSSFMLKDQRFLNTGVSNRLITQEHIVFIKGFDDGLVRPNGNITRAEVATIFYRLLKDRNVPITAGFSDVPEGKWFTEAVNTLASLGIVNGMGDGRFEPNRNITRAEFTAIACRFSNMIVSELRFLDVPEKHWAAKYIACAAGYGWINGYGNGNFGPDDPITRAQAVAIVNRMLGRVPDKAYIRANRASLISFPDLTNEDLWYYFDIYEAANAHSFKLTDGEERWGTT